MSLYQHEAEALELEERMRAKINLEIESRLKSVVIECDECGAKLPFIYDEGKLKVDTYHSCNVPEPPRRLLTSAEIKATLCSINNAYKKRRGL